MANMIIVIGVILLGALIFGASVRRKLVWLVPLTLALLAIGGFLSVAGHCDPDAHLFVRNNYPFPIVAHHLANPARNMPDQILDTVPGGIRAELRQNTALDGDIDNIQIEDTKGHVFARLNQKNKNVICRKTTPEYVWDITIGP